jgi:uncharacterized membrane protein YfcA
MLPTLAVPLALALDLDKAFSSPSPALALLLAGAAFLAGLVDAIGGGGGLISLPALLAAGLPPAVAIGTNKGQAIFGATSSFISFWRRGGIDRDRAPLGFAAGFAGSCAGAWALMAMRPEPLRPLVIALLAGATLVGLVGRRGLSVPTPPTPTPTGAPGSGSIALTSTPTGRMRSGGGVDRRTTALVLIAAGLGAYDGFFGPGAGSMLILAFALVFGDSLTRASGNAKVVNLASNLAAFLLFARRGTIIWSLALPMAAANALGAALGARLALRRGDRLVRWVVLMMVLAVIGKLTRDLLRR